jgi:hypothetical protein
VSHGLRFIAALCGLVLALALCAGMFVLPLPWNVATASVIIVAVLSLVIVALWQITETAA